MTKNDLILALQDETLLDRSKVEDFLQALGDLCVDALGRGESFMIPNIGVLRSTPQFRRQMVSFISADKVRDELGTAAPLCVSCKKNDREPQRRKCAECRRQTTRKRDSQMIADQKFSWL
jgi:nucleoid DNA-binding protein